MNSTYIVGVRAGEGSILASFCISACRDAAFKLPPVTTEGSDAKRILQRQIYLTASFVQGVLLRISGSPLLMDCVDT